MTTMHENVLLALGALNLAREHLEDAERTQSEMDPIEGPGSREWEIVRERIDRAEADLRLAFDQPGELERITDLEPHCGHDDAPDCGCEVAERAMSTDGGE